MTELQVYAAVPDDCEVTVSRVADTDEQLDSFTSYCDECQERHRFVLTDE